MLSHSLLIAAIFLCCFSGKILGGEPEIKIDIIPVSCFTYSDGEIRILIPDCEQIYTAEIYGYSPTGNLLEAERRNDTTSFTASNLAVGKYFLLIKSDKGLSFTRNVEIQQPEKLQTGRITVEKKLSALDASDAILKTVPEGGVPPYTYSWNIETEQKHSPEIKNVGQGTYSCIINDSNNCGPVKATILFNQYVIPDIVEE
jgi:hypothetical protein